MSEEAKRMERVRHNLETAQSWNGDIHVGFLRRYKQDVPYLLKRVEELENSKRKLQAMVERAEKGQFNWMNRYHEEAGMPYLDYIDGERPG
jgi:hypothetical protein